VLPDRRCCPIRVACWVVRRALARALRRCPPELSAAHHLRFTCRVLGTAVRRLGGALGLPAGWRETESSQCEYGITVAIPWLPRAWARGGQQPPERFGQADSKCCSLGAVPSSCPSPPAARLSKVPKSSIPSPPLRPGDVGAGPGRPRRAGRQTRTRTQTPRISSGPGPGPGQSRTLA
jgi:hypothetical protein